MKTFLASLALIIFAAFVFEVHQLTKAVLGPKVQVRLNFDDVCGSYMETQKAARSDQSTRECISWAASYFPQGMVKNKRAEYMTASEVKAFLDAELGPFDN